MRRRVVGITVACLGDVVGYGPDPNEVTTMIRELGARTIRGNHDKAATDLMETDDFNPVAKAAVDWTRSQLSAENLKWISELPSGPLETDGIVLVHGAFQDEDEYVFTPAQALEGLLDSTSAVTFFGHTHHQGGFSYENQKSQLEMLNIHPRAHGIVRTVRIESERRYLLNPGSIGQPRDGDPRAGFAIADLDNQVVEFWRVPYDISDVQVPYAHGATYLSRWCSASSSAANASISGNRIGVGEILDRLEDPSNTFAWKLSLLPRNVRNFGIEFMHEEPQIQIPDRPGPESGGFNFALDSCTAAVVVVIGAAFYFSPGRQSPPGEAPPQFISLSVRRASVRS